jgi:hypothetical protein
MTRPRPAGGPMLRRAGAGVAMPEGFPIFRLGPGLTWLKHI